MTDHNGIIDDDPELAALLQSLEPEDFQQHEPPTGLWESIEQAALQEEQPSALRLVEDEKPPPIRQAPSRLWQALSAAAVAILVAAVTIGLVLRDDTDPEPEILAQADLVFADGFDPLGVDAAATAAFVNDDGTVQVSLTDLDLPEVGADEDLELWLISPDSEGAVADLFSLGLVEDGDTATFTVPANYSTEEFFVVDISVEPRDGDETHSGRSILRAPLERA